MTRGFGAILHKDLRLEMRSGQSTTALAALSLLVLVVLVIALGRTGPGASLSAAGALWVALLFAGMLGATRATVAERENGCLSGLMIAPVDRAVVFLAKLAAAFIFMAIAEIFAVILLVLFFNLDFDARLAMLAPILALGTLGFAALSTLLATISSRTRAGDLLLPMLAVPLFVPALIAGVSASAAVLGAGHEPRFWSYVNILIAFDVLFVTVGYLLFEHVAGEA